MLFESISCIQWLETTKLPEIKFSPATTIVHNLLYQWNFDALIQALILLLGLKLFPLRLVHILLIHRKAQSKTKQNEGKVIVLNWNSWWTTADTITSKMFHHSHSRKPHMAFPALFIDSFHFNSWLVSYSLCVQ